MNEDVLQEVRDLWNRVASDWRTQVGDHGDENRRLNSDPVLWDFAGDVSGLDVLDAGCGTGYLSRQLSARGARVVGVDLSENMIRIAQESSPEVDYRVVVRFEEPRITADRYHLAPSSRELESSKTRPYSVAFKLAT
jgi:2-polyprenyl-3-methyl-5-hydroxy-6-metoxy-1,4-benzoquinol methylase